AYTGEDGTVHHAELSLNADMIMLGSGSADGRSAVYIALDTAADVDALYARAKSAGADITRELNDTDYGSHEFGVRDPEGHGWSFGTYRPSSPAP
ncbi:MAG: VOC family protein, partial [Candidatus Eremiobacteraeota bacterium]|nr:VOC family protein [Candidatus Eremiobacteraeota bacterium]